MKTRNGQEMYAGVMKAMRNYAEGVPEQIPHLKVFLEDMHALSYLEDKVRDFIERHELDPSDAERPES